MILFAETKVTVTFTEQLNLTQFDGRCTNHTVYLCQLYSDMHRIPADYQWNVSLKHWQTNKEETCFPFTKILQQIYRLLIYLWCPEKQRNSIQETLLVGLSADRLHQPLLQDWLFALSHTIQYCFNMSGIGLYILLRSLDFTVRRKHSFRYSVI